jgi:predicted nuclease with TOPRIM domain
MADAQRNIILILGVLVGILVISNIWTYLSLQNEISAYSNLQNQINSIIDEKTNLQSQVDFLTDEKNNLQNQVNTVQTQLNSLNATYQKYMATHSHTDSEYNALNSQITSLQTQIGQLLTDKTNLQNQIYSLNQSYQKILDEYKLLNAPASNFVSYSDLDFSITTYQHIYSYKDPVSGNVTIHYHNGTAFRGTFSIFIYYVGGVYGYTSGWTFAVNGYGEFYVNPPESFMHGPGTYQIGFENLYDSEGYVIATHVEIGHIYVTVEAK